MSEGAAVGDVAGLIVPEWPEPGGQVSSDVDVEVAATAGIGLL